MKILIGQLNPTVGAVSQNVSAMLDVIEQAKRQQAQVVIFPELAVPGYPPKDLLHYPEFVDLCLEANTVFQKASSGGVLVIWGNIARNNTGIGKPLHNAGYCAFNGELVAIAHKAHLPTYDVFDEARYFEPGLLTTAVPIFECFGHRIALSICEDMWSHDCFSEEEKNQITPVQYATRPLEAIPPGSIDFLLNISSSPYVLGKPALRNILLQRLAASQHAAIVYANQVGANDDLIFDGNSSITLPNRVQAVLKGFEVSTQCFDSDAMTSTLIANQTPESELLAALTLGIRDYVHKTGFKKVFLGLSGGIDSALTAVLAQRALGNENVVAVAMPGPYSSTHSVEDAVLLAQNLEIELRQFSINGPFESYLHLLNGGNRKQDLAEQNLQARLRGTLLMTLSNRENALVLTTGNKSEIATGYSTLYGDSCGALAPLGDLFKTHVYQLCNAINADAGWSLIPQRILEKPPSAELAPDQKDSDSLPPYPILDKILKGILEDQLGFGELVNLGYDKDYILSTFERVLANEYKRHQMAPILKVSTKAFGSGRVYPIVQKLRFPTRLDVPAYQEQ